MKTIYENEFYKLVKSSANVMARIDKVNGSIDTLSFEALNQMIINIRR